MQIFEILIDLIGKLLIFALQSRFINKACQDFEPRLDENLLLTCIIMKSYVIFK